MHHHVRAVLGEQEGGRRTRHLGIDQHLERVVIDEHRFGGIDRLSTGLGHHGGDQFTDETHDTGRERGATDAGRKQRHVDGDGTDAIGHQIVVCEHAEHTGHPTRRVSIDRHDARVRHGGPHVHHVYRTGHDQIVDVRRVARHQGRILGPYDPLAHHSHRQTPESGPALRASPPTA